MDKYRKQKGSEEIKVDERSERRMRQVNRARPTESYWEKGRSVAKPIAGKRENDLRQIEKIPEK